jgi:3-oxoadipate enol-lactonase
VQPYYESVGTGEPLVLWHAGIADLRMWDAQVEPFAQRYRVIRLDAQGFGRSPAAAEPTTRAQELFDFLTGLGIDRAHLIGVSAFGAAVIDFAVEHPTLVHTLMPVASGLSGHTPRDKAIWQWLDAQDALLDEALEHGDVDTATDIDLRVWLAGPRRRLVDMDPHLRERARAMARLAEERGAERKPTPALDPPAAARLHTITAPTLVMVGEEDPPPMLEMANAIVSGIPGAQKIVFPDTAHMIPMERPDDFNRAVLDFLQRHPMT